MPDTPEHHRPISFIHIPKTAGTTVRHYLASHVHQDRVCPANLLRELIEFSPARLEGFGLFYGHFGVYLRKLLPHPATECTILRDPVQRTISQFRDQKGRHDLWLADWIRDKSLQRYLESPIGQAEVINMQTRCLAMDRFHDDHFDYSRLRDEDFPALKRRCTDPALADRAIQTLESLAVVGISESLDDSLALLAAEMGWCPPGPAPRVNASRVPLDDDACTDRAMDLIAELTALDRIVYEHARGLFQRRWEASTPQARLAAYHRRLAALPRTDRVRLTPADPLDGRNWWPGRGVDDAGRPVRWAGPDHVTTIDLPLAPSTDLVLVGSAVAPSPDALEYLTIAAGGATLGLERWRPGPPGDGRWQFRAVIPGDAVDPDAPCTTLTFQCPTATQALPDGGYRTLSFGFHWLDLFPARSRR